MNSMDVCGMGVVNVTPMHGRKQISKVNYATPHDLWINTMKPRRALNAAGYVVVEMWECEWKRMKDGDKDFPA